MNSKARRALRVTAAVAVACSLIGVQALSPVDASGGSTITWRPSSPPAGTGFWSNSCPTGGQQGTGIPNDSSNLHKTLQDDPQSVAASRTMVAETGADIGWGYAPATATTEGGPVITLANPASTTSLSAMVQGASNGHAMVFYQGAGASDYYVGIAPLTSTAAWAQQTATTFSWYHWSANFLQQYSWNPMFVPFLSTTPTPKTIADFATSGGSGGNAVPAGTWYASFEFGCTGPFAIDHIQVTDSGGVTDYDLQNPLSSTTTATSLSSIGPGGSASISSATTADGSAITDGTATLQSSPDGGTWTDVASQPNGTSFAVAPTQTTRYRINFDGAADAAASQSSNSVTVTVAPKVTLKASRSTMNVGNSATFTATFAPVRSGITITFQQQSGSTWSTIGTATTNSSGVATLTKSRSATGLWTVRAYSAAQARYPTSNKPSVTLKVYQPVSISIYRSYSTVYVGRSFRIYGTVTPHRSGISLQLQQYVGTKWIIVATGHSGTHGAYSFTKTARTVGTAKFRVVAPASGYRRRGVSPTVKVYIVRAPVYTPPPPPPPSGGGGSGIG